MRSALFQLDAFTDRLFAGNPAAVMPGHVPGRRDDAVDRGREQSRGDGVPGARRRRLPTALVFTPTVEVRLCGHATLAGAAVVMERLEPGRATVVFHSASGPLLARRAGPYDALDFPAAVPTPVTSSESIPVALAAALGATPVDVMAWPTRSTTWRSSTMQRACGR